MKSLVIATTLTLVITTVSTSAGADSKFYPATLCNAIDGASPSYWTTGAAFNASTTVDRYFVCPVVRDTVRTDGSSWSSLVVTALNLHPTIWMTCFAATSYPDDYEFGHVDANQLHPSSDWTDLSFPTISVPSTGYMVLNCRVPRFTGPYPSGLASYRIDE